MGFEWDERKAAANLAKHGVSFDIVHQLRWQTAETRLDGRRDYGEPRFRVIVADQDGHYYVVILTPRFGQTRIISIRRAGRREVR